MRIGQSQSQNLHTTAAGQTPRLVLVPKLSFYYRIPPASLTKPLHSLRTWPTRCVRQCKSGTPLPVPSPLTTTSLIQNVGAANKGTHTRSDLNLEGPSWRGTAAPRTLGCYALDDDSH
jgi:hypothetical protein